jgi:MFS family permease
MSVVGSSRDRVARLTLVLIASFAFVFDLFALLPLLPRVLENQDLNVGLLVPLFIVVRSWTIGILILPAGMVIDKVGIALPVLISSIAKALGFLLIALSGDSTHVLLAAALLGIGTAVTRPAMKAAIASAALPDGSTRLFAGQAMVLNLAVVVGPLAAQLAIWLGMAWPALWALVVIEIIVGVGVWVAVRRHSRPQAVALDPWAALRRSLTKPLVRIYQAQMLLAIAMGLALSVLLTLRSGDGVGAFVGVAIAYQSVCLIVFQLPTLFATRFASRAALCGPAIAAALVAVVFISLGNWWGVFGGLTLLAAAEVVAAPLINSLVAAEAAERDRATAFAVLGLGETLGDGVGGLIAAGLVVFSAIASPTILLAIVCGVLAVAATGPQVLRFARGPRSAL